MMVLQHPIGIFHGVTALPEAVVCRSMELCEEVKQSRGRKAGTD